MSFQNCKDWIDHLFIFGSEHDMTFYSMSHATISPSSPMIE